MRIGRYLLLAIAAVAVTLSLINASWLAGAPPGRLILVARNGYVQPVRPDASGPCAAVQMANSGQLFIENSIHGMREAVRLGAGALALDVRRTADGQLVLFRDQTLDCRTNGIGPVSARTLAELRQLDIGYDYTPDRGETFPLRGRGIGGIATVDNVLAAFRNEKLIFIFRDNDPAIAEAMAAAIGRTQTRLDERIGFVGPDQVLARMRTLAPGTWSFDRQASEACLAAYRSSGWTSFVPDECRDRMLALTQESDWRLWGWPYRFYARMAGVGAEVMAVDGFDTDGVPIGLGRAEQLGDIPREFRGWLWVEDMGRVGRALIR